MTRKESFKKKGFTLIELLVVISIIGLLATIVMVSLNSARGKARDARRKGDLHQIQLALQMYYDANGQYPSVTGWIHSCNSSWDTLQTALAPYISKLPKDPRNTPCIDGPWYNRYYVYSYGYNTSSYPGRYDLVAQLENTSDNDRCAVKCWRYHTGGGNNPWCSGCGGSYTYSAYLYADH